MIHEKEAVSLSTRERWLANLTSEMIMNMEKQRVETIPRGNQ